MSTLKPYRDEAALAPIGGIDGDLKLLRVGDLSLVGEEVVCAGSAKLKLLAVLYERDFVDAVNGGGQAEVSELAVYRIGNGAAPPLRLTDAVNVMYEYIDSLVTDGVDAFEMGFGPVLKIAGEIASCGDKLLLQRVGGGGSALRSLVIKDVGLVGVEEFDYKLICLVFIAEIYAQTASVAAEAAEEMP